MLNQPKNSESPETSLIDAAARGDAASFEQLVRRYQDRLLTSLTRFTGSREQAEDIAQEAFVQAYRKLDQFRRDSSFYTWLHRIAQNRAMSAGRKKRERVSIEALRDAADGAPIIEPQTEVQPEADLVSEEQTKLVHRALATLAEDYRRILVLREFDGLDYQQIAEATGIAIGTVRSRLFRARTQLRDALIAAGACE